MGLTTYSIIFIGLYIVFCIGVGVYAQRKATSSDQYVVARRRLHPAILAVAASATVGSGITFLGCPGFAYSFGYPGLWYSTSWCWLVPLVTLLTFYTFRRLVEKKGSMTIPGYLADRFNSDTVRILTVILACVAQVFFLGGQFTGAGHIMHVIFDIPYSWGVVLMAVVITFYVAAGGYRSIAITNVLQGFLMFFCALLIFFSAYVFFPEGVGALNERLASIDPNSLKVFNPKAGAIGGSIFAVYCMAIPLAFYSFSPQTSSHLLATRDFSIKTILLYVFIMWLMFFVYQLTPLAGVAAKAHGIEVARPDSVLAVMVKQQYSPLFAAFLLIAILSAIWSTSDVVLFAIATGVSNEVFANFIAKRKGYSVKKTDAWNMNIARIIMVALAVFSVVLVLNPPEFLVTFIWIGLGSAMVIIAPIVVVSSLWERASRIGAIATMIIGIIVFYSMLIGGVAPFTASGIQLPITVVSLIIISLIFRDETGLLVKENE